MIVLFDTDASVTDDTIRHSYVSSLYYVIVTLCAVGYGDITPISDGATAFAILVEATGFLIFSNIVGASVPLLFQRMIEEFNFTHNKELVLKYLANYCPDQEIVQKTLQV